MEASRDIQTVDLVMTSIGQALRHTAAGQINKSELLGSCVFSCLEGVESFSFFHGQSGLANWSLAEINDSVGMSNHAYALVRCAEGYVAFCKHAANMNAVAANAARYLRSRMCIDWQHEDIIEELQTRVRRNIQGVVSYFFREVQGVWEQVKESMQALLQLVEQLICRIKEAAFVSTDDVDSTDVDHWEADYNESLQRAVEYKRVEFMKLVKHRMLANLDVYEVVEQILDEHQSSDHNNMFIDHNPDHRRSPREMALYISDQRSTLVAQDVDDYLNYDAIFVLAEEAIAAFTTEDTPPRTRVVRGTTTITGNKNVFVLPGVTDINPGDIKPEDLNPES